jgi:flagellum-specific peptidoglycan hydrolase FlgJ
VNIQPEIIAAAKAAQAKWKVPASVSLAQFGIESAWGAKMPHASNNPFGIKARAGEPFVTCPTHEVVHGQRILVQAAFRKFDTLAAAFDRHGELLATAPVYATAMSWLPDLSGFVSNMAAHYATAPDYAAAIMGVIKGAHLDRFDAVA